MDGAGATSTSERDGGADFRCVQFVMTTGAVTDTSEHGKWCSYLTGSTL
jgi:hypothetical protein